MANKVPVTHRNKFIFNAVLNGYLSSGPLWAYKVQETHNNRPASHQDCSEGKLEELEEIKSESIY